MTTAVWQCDKNGNNMDIGIKI